MFDNVNKVLKEISGSALWDEKSGMDFDYITALEENNAEVCKNILNTSSSTGDSITLQELLTIPFNTAKEKIMLLSFKRRLELLEECNKLNEHYSVYMSAFGKEGVPKDEQVSESQFRSVLGKVKHMDIIVNWLYGIY